MTTSKKAEFAPCTNSKKIRCSIRREVDGKTNTVNIKDSLVNVFNDVEVAEYVRTKGATFNKRGDENGATRTQQWTEQGETAVQKLMLLFDKAPVMPEPIPENVTAAQSSEHAEAVENSHTTKPIRSKGVKA